MGTKGRLNPFGDSSKNFVFFPSLSHKKGVHRIVRGLESNCGLILLTGEIGIGKTSLARHIQSYLSDRFVFVELGNPYQTPLEQVFYCCEAFGLDTAGLSSIHDCVGRLEKYFHTVLEQGKRPVIVFDESHLLTKRHLSLIHILSNLRAEDGPLVQIILVGQLEILDLLATEGMEALNQRIGVRCQLAPLGMDDTDKYINFKLDKSGKGGLVEFSREAVERIWKESSGLPRLINHVCAHALDTLAFKDSNVVTPAMVDEVCEESVYTGMFKAKTNKEPEPPRRQSRALSPVFLVLAIVVVGAVWYQRGMPLPQAVVNTVQQVMTSATQAPEPTPAPEPKSAPEPTVAPEAPAAPEPVAVSPSEPAVPVPTVPAEPEQAANPNDTTWEYKEGLSDQVAESAPVAETPTEAESLVPPSDVLVVVEDPAGESIEASVAGPSDTDEPSGEAVPVFPPLDEVPDGSTHPVIGNLVIGAIAWNDVPTESVAVINSELLHEGETVDDVRVLNIGLDYILFEYDGEFYKLTFAQ